MINSVLHILYFVFINGFRDIKDSQSIYVKSKEKQVEVEFVHLPGIGLSKAIILKEEYASKLCRYALNLQFAFALCSAVM